MFNYIFLSYNYAQTGNDALNKMYAANYATVLCLYAKGDIGVNYYGWSEDDVYRFISQYGFDDKSVAHEMYYSFVSDPGNYCKYYQFFIAVNSCVPYKIFDRRDD